MPRRTRIHVDDLPLYILERGHDRAACCSDDQDRLAYLGWLRETLAPEYCRLHAWVLMTHQVHPLLTAERAEAVSSCSKAISVNQQTAWLVFSPAFFVAATRT